MAKLKGPKTLLKALAAIGALWLLVSITFLPSTTDESRPVELRRSRTDLEQFKPAQPSVKFKFPQVPLLQKPLEQVVGLFQKGEPDRNIIPPPLDVQLKKPTRDSNAPGELGKPVHIKVEDLPIEERKKYDDGFQRNAYSEYTSDMISVHRQLPDVRDVECKAKSYSDDLPETSIIMCFHNEAWSVLLRSVHSIIDRSDPKLLKEIILVDDFSDLPHLGEKLKDYMDKLKLVQIVRMKQREGLIRARLAGAKAASGKVLTFLDSHIECSEGWLEPLLQEIKKNKSTVVTPVIDSIDDTSFEFYFSSAKHTSVGGFDWTLQFNWHAIPPREFERRKDELDPIHSPTMAGGLFSISNEYFVELGTYDAGMDIWGGENLEMSFRIWMCGGTLVIVPCSQVGHIFRKRSPYTWRTGVDVVKKNAVRLAEVWLDDYKHHYYDRINYNLGNYGDISSRVQLRKNLKCKSFDWYIKNIYPELFIPDQALFSGEVSNAASARCLDSPTDHLSYNKPINLLPCHNQGGNQYWMMSAAGEIRRDDGCLDHTGSGYINLYRCHGQGGNQKWIYKDSMIVHDLSQKCMQVSADGYSLTMDSCDSGNRYQIWAWKSKKTKSN